MAKKQKGSSSIKDDFELFLKSCPKKDDIKIPSEVQAYGAITQTSDDNVFLLQTSDNVTHEIPKNSVEKFTVFSSSPDIRTVQISLNRETLGDDLANQLQQTDKLSIKPPVFDKLLPSDKLPPSDKLVPFDTLKEASDDTIKEQPFDTLKEPSDDTIKEQPFDTLKEPSDDTIKEQPFDTLKELSNDTIKEQSFDTLKEPSDDTIKEQPFDTLKELSNDTLKELAKDPIGEGTGIADTLVEGINGGLNSIQPELQMQLAQAMTNPNTGMPPFKGVMQDPLGTGWPDTLVEGVQSGAFTSSVNNQQGLGLQQGITPFVLATPHQAPQGALAQQHLAVQAMQGRQGF